MQQNRKVFKNYHKHTF